MIQFNLLPDIKQEFIRSKRNKHIVMVVSTIVSASAISILVLLYLGVGVFQKKHMDDLTKDINNKSQQLKGTPDLDKILTIQNQLNNLDALHSKKPVSSRFFNFANKFTPNTVTISSSTIDFTKNTISIAGNAPDLGTVNQFVDTLKFSKYHYPQLDDKGQPMVDQNQDPVYVTKTAFTSVVLTSFAINTDSSGNVNASYQVDFSFDPTLFDITKDVELIVPQQITTRSETEKPTLYKGGSTKTNQSKQ
jgi:hypothetical protein